MRTTLNVLEKINIVAIKQYSQDDIVKLIKWSNKWQMLFNLGKCKCLQKGHGNIGMNYQQPEALLLVKL